MVTYVQLRVADPTDWEAAAYQFRLAASDVADHADALAGRIAEVDDAWQGPASAQLLDHLLVMRSRLVAALPALIAIDQALSEFAETVRLARAALSAALADAAQGVTIGADGTVSAGPRPDPAIGASAAATARAIAVALLSASRADTGAAARLSAAADGFDPRRQEPPPYVPGPGTPPSQVASWWAGLSADQRRYQVAQDAAALCALDGVPADARDQAARLLLFQRRGELRARAATLAAPVDDDPLDRVRRAELAQVNAELDGLAVTLARLDADGGPRAYLLDIDPGRNRAIISIGDPDRAANVLTFVGGVGSGLTGATSEISPIDAIARAGDARSPASETAVVGWMEYDAPPNLGHAATDVPARAAEIPLDAFEVGLRVTHQGHAAHDSLLGYSYGSTVVGYTARDTTMPVDDVLLVGSPGVGVDTAAELRVPPGHVWATRAANDAIRFAVDPGQRMLGLVGLGHPDAMWFGTAPTAPEFGAHVFSSDPGTFWHPVRTHESYFEPGATSLTNIARVVTGDGRDVS